MTTRLFCGIYQNRLLVEWNSFLMNITSVFEMRLILWKLKQYSLFHKYKTFPSSYFEISSMKGILPIRSFSSVLSFNNIRNHTVDYGSNHGLWLFSYLNSSFSPLWPFLISRLISSVPILMIYFSYSSLPYNFEESATHRLSVMSSIP